MALGLHAELQVIQRELVTIIFIASVTTGKNAMTYQKIGADVFPGFLEVLIRR